MKKLMSIALAAVLALNLAACGNFEPLSGKASTDGSASMAAMPAEEPSSSAPKTLWRT